MSETPVPARNGRWPLVGSFVAAAATVAIGAAIAGPGRVLDPSGFPRRWDCGVWEPELGWLHVVSDVAIFGAYLSLPIVLLAFTWRHRQALPFRGLLLLFGAFILACGIGHLLEAVIFWQPVYRLSGVVKLATAVVSWATVVAMFRIMPRAVRLSGLAIELEQRRLSGERLERANAELTASRAAAIGAAAESDRLKVLAERYLNESRAAETMSRQIVEASPAAQILIDGEGRIVMFNRMAERIFGYERGDLLGRPIEELVPHRFRDEHVRQRDAYYAQPSARAMGAGRDLFGVRKDGSEVPVEIGLNPVETQQGRCVLASVIDITSRRQAESELRSYADALAATNLELEQFAQFASHDLQEPLRKLVSFSKLLVDDLPGELPPEARRDLGFIEDSARRMRELVRGLLDLSNSGRRELQLEEVPLDRCVRDALDALSERIAERDARIDVAPLPTVRGDKRLLTQLFQNLIGNALKFQPEGVQPQIRVECAATAPAVEIAVQDNGIGIQPEYAAEIFKPFKRLHGRGHYEGAGIGLALCNKVVTRHGGRIWVTSELGKGARFHFTLESAAAQG